MLLGAIRMYCEDETLNFPVQIATLCLYCNLSEMLLRLLEEGLKEGQLRRAG